MHSKIRIFQHFSLIIMVIVIFRIELYNAKSTNTISTIKKKVNDDSILYVIFDRVFKSFKNKMDRKGERNRCLWKICSKPLKKTKEDDNNERKVCLINQSLKAIELSFKKNNI